MPTESSETSARWILVAPATASPVVSVTTVPSTRPGLSVVALRLGGSSSVVDVAPVEVIVVVVVVVVVTVVVVEWMPRNSLVEDVAVITVSSRASVVAGALVGLGFQLKVGGRIVVVVVAVVVAVVVVVTGTVTPDSLMFHTAAAAIKSTNIPKDPHQCGTVWMPAKYDNTPVFLLESEPFPSCSADLSSFDSESTPSASTFVGSKLVSAFGLPALKTASNFSTDDAAEESTCVSIGWNSILSAFGLRKPNITFDDALGISRSTDTISDGAVVDSESISSGIPRVASASEQSKDTWISSGTGRSAATLEPSQDAA
mmetsp:Transcript_17760/g.32938  ORF Transcript_17760/g.32938 Transcript_17760/m.32938 type:complete len:315 (-) Transcript_17760:200-1144(-)